MQDRIYIAIDLKSFYASVECIERNLDPISTNLVVADSNRTEKTICLAVTPSLKKIGIPGRARLFEVVQKVKEINLHRKSKIKNKYFSGKSFDENELEKNPNLELDYIIAPPRMSLYMKYSTKIYNIYLKYFSKDDIFPYSIDEIFCDVTDYLETYKMTAKDLITTVIKDVYETTGITATAGIGTNLYLCKIAMDIVSKHIKPDINGVRIAELNEISYRKLLWEHRPLTDFWRVGNGYKKKLEGHGIYTMGDIARISIENEDLLYDMFGINAELLIDHAWGYEPCTIESVKSYRPTKNSISSSQVLHCPYNYEKTKLIVKEMTELLTLDLVGKKLITDQIVLTVGYDIENLKNYNILKQYKGEVTVDKYGRRVPKHAHGTINLDYKTSSTRIITNSVMQLFDRIIDENLLTRRINIIANNVISESMYNEEDGNVQLDIFTDYIALEKLKKERKEKEEKEKKLQKVVIDIKNKYGKNAILKGMDFEKGGTTIQRNTQIGGHKG